MADVELNYGFESRHANRFMRDGQDEERAERGLESIAGHVDDLEMAFVLALASVELVCRTFGEGTDEICAEGFVG